MKTEVYGIVIVDLTIRMENICAARSSLEMISSCGVMVTLSPFQRAFEPIAIAVDSRRIFFVDKRQLPIHMDDGTNMLAGAQACKHRLDGACWLTPETMVSIPGLDCAG
jgi:hypothetical protein